jgi:hypothetical protein
MPLIGSAPACRGFTIRVRGKIPGYQKRPEEAVSSVVLIVLAAAGAFFIGRFAEKARTAHDLYTSYKSRVGTNFWLWLRHSTMVVLIGAGTLALVVSVIKR